MEKLEESLEKLNTDFTTAKDSASKASYLTTMLLSHQYKTTIVEETDSDDFLEAAIVTLSNSILRDLKGQLTTIVQRNKEAKDAEITDQLRQPLEDQRQLQEELATLLKQIQDL